MALTFPTSPTNGQIFTDTTTGNRYIYVSASGLWKFASNSVGMSVSSTPPANVAPGAMWFNREIGRTFVYYDDGDSKQWIETVPAGAVDTNTIAGYVNPVFASMNGAYTTANSGYVTANAGFGKANTALQNTSGTFAGTLTVAGQVSAIGNNNIRTTYVYPTSWSSVDSSAYGYSPIPGELAIINNQDGTTNSFASIYLQGGVNAGGGAGINSGRIALLRDGNAAYAGAMVFANRDASSANMTERMRIDSSGNVGIGKTDPAYTLDVNGTIADTTGVIRPLVSGTAVTASTPTVQFTGIPSWVKRVVIVYSNLVNSTTSSVPLVRIGSGSLSTSGYTAYGAHFNTAAGSQTSTAGIPLEGGARASGVYAGRAEFFNVSGNLWQGTLNGFLTAGTSLCVGSGYITLGGVLDRIAIATNTAGSFTAGTVNVFYE